MLNGTLSHLVCVINENMKFIKQLWKLWLLFGTNGLYWTLEIKMTTYQLHEISYSFEWKSLSQSNKVILPSLSADYSNSSYSGQVQYWKFTKYQWYGQRAAPNRILWKFPSGTSKFRLWIMFNKSFGLSFTSIISSHPLHQPNPVISSIINPVYHVPIILCFALCLLCSVSLCYKFLWRC